MADKTWKAVERKIAKLFKTTRTPFSGGNSKHTRSDTLHKDLFIEIKHRKKHSTWALYKETAEMAKVESKLPIVVLKQKGQRGELVCLKLEDLRMFYDILIEHEIITNNGKGTIL